MVKLLIYSGLPVVWVTLELSPAELEKPWRCLGEFHQKKIGGSDITATNMKEKT